MQRSDTPVHSSEYTEVAIRERRHGYGTRMIGWLLSWLLRIHGATWRVNVEGMEHLEAAIARGDKVLIVFWHGKYVPLFPLLAGHSACVFCSISSRGDIIAEMCRRFGFEVLQIPDHGGDRSLNLMRRMLSERQVGAIAVDGPLGPRRAVHIGPIRLASDLGCILMPVSLQAMRKHVRERRWDEMEFPALFARLYLIIGDPLTIPSSLTEQQISRWRVRLGAALTALDRRAEHKVVSQDKSE